MPSCGDTDFGRGLQAKGELTFYDILLGGA